MDFDIVFPQSNEEEFIQMAERINTAKVCFVYSLKEFDFGKKKLNELQSKTKTRLTAGVLVKNIGEIQKAKQKTDFIIAEASEDARQFLENKSIQLIFGLENSTRKDSFHHRNSGLNQVLCSLAKKNDITIGLKFSNILNSAGRQRTVLLGRIAQNLRFCRKYTLDAALLSFAKHPYEMRSMHDLAAFSRVLARK